MNESLFYEIKITNIMYQDVIEEIGSQLKKDQYIQSESVFIEEVHKREQHGNIEIFPEVILPHIQSENILRLKFFLLKNKTNLILCKDSSLKLSSIARHSSIYEEFSRRRLCRVIIIIGGMKYEYREYLCLYSRYCTHIYRS
ncbi:PTS sugar transporter subunit IIA [Mammaliicoccus sciuri]|uniref:PTS sugar transporter subunit IIA n=1 Tax=Mammaliicoccus sciuri TaxID=1296 RepID=UPI0039845C36